MDLKWVKVCTESIKCRGYQLTLGENVDTLYDYNPTLCEPGGLHFCKVEDASHWANMLDYDWVCDVTIPPDAEVTHGDIKSKASKLTLSNHRTLRECSEIYLAAVQKHEHALWCVPVGMKTFEMCLAAVQQHGLSMEYVPKELKTPEMCLVAVQQDGMSLKYVPEEDRTPDICLTAVQQTYLALKYVPVEFIGMMGAIRNKVALYGY